VKMCCSQLKHKDTTQLGMQDKLPSQKSMFST